VQAKDLCLGKPLLVTVVVTLGFHGFGVARPGPWNTVEKVGVELRVTINRALRVPKTAYLVPDLRSKRA
jgi:hypothetical protein